jgi:hypothetical protein
MILKKSLQTSIGLSLIPRRKYYQWEGRWQEVIGLDGKKLTPKL